MNGGAIRPNVEKVFLLGKRAPVITITRRSTYPVGRSVGFIYRVLSDGRLVVATARHVFDPEQDPGASELRLVDQKTTLTVESWFCSPRPADDIAFLVITAVPQFRPIIFGRPRREEWLPKIVYNAKNSIGEGPYPVFLAAQSAGCKVHDTLVFSLGREKGYERVDPANTERIEELRSLDYSELCLAQLYSRPGFSGSPIWDDEWNLYGMGSGGTDGTSENGDQIIYYPASYLDKVWADISSNNKF